MEHEQETRQQKLMQYLKTAVDEKASDLFFTAGAKIHMKKDKHLVAISDEILRPDDSNEMVTALYELAEREVWPYCEDNDDDFSMSVPGLARFRVNTYRQRGSMAAVVRVVTFGIPDYKVMGIPENIMNLADLKDGLVLFTGSAGSGKSTTQACIIDRINERHDAHIITLEDPIEYLHRNKNSIVSQREIGTDTLDYLTGLRACLRQAPDIIQLGEMRDHETISTAITAAETGHLVMATLHTKGAENTIDRIVDSFPGSQQNQIRVQLSMALRTVVSQQLLPTLTGGLVPAFEVMNVTTGIQTLIREGRTQNLNSYISSGAEDGMISMDQSILVLFQAGLISKETALLYAMNSNLMAQHLG